MRNLSTYHHIAKLSRTCFCVVLLSLMIVATTSLQITHNEPHKNTVADHRESVYSVALVLLNDTVKNSDDTNKELSLETEQKKRFINAFIKRYQQANISGFASYLLFYSEFNSHSKAALISYLHQQSLP
ncbi:uroporphyrinogen decarboxylase [Glaciecola sp. KUL10]|nr:uroporphyrinogen decarboxylase [Glaciecola sp. KUL10]